MWWRKTEHVLRLGIAPHVLRLGISPHVLRLGITPHVLRLGLGLHVFRLGINLQFLFCWSHFLFNERGIPWGKQHELSVWGSELSAWG